MAEHYEGHRLTTITGQYQLVGTCECGHVSSAASRDGLAWAHEEHARHAAAMHDLAHFAAAGLARARAALADTIERKAAS